MNKTAGLAALATAIALGLSGCNTASNSVNSGPSLNTGNSVAGLALAATAGGTGTSGYVSFNNASTINISTGGNPDNLNTITINTSNGDVSLAPIAGELPGIYPIYISAADSSGNTAAALLQAYVYGTSGSAAAGNAQNSTAPSVITFPAASLGAGGNGTLTIGVRNGLVNVSTQGIALTPAVGTVNAVNGDISIGSVIANDIANTDTATLTANFVVTTLPVAGAGSSGCSNGTLLVLQARPYYNNGENPPTYQEFICLNFS